MRRWLFGGGIVLVLVMAALSQWLPPYALDIASRALLFAIFAMSLDLLLGYAGLPSLGHAAFFGLGAYVVALLATRVTSNLFVTMGIAILVTIAVAAVFGVVSLRSRGVYFMMLTLALSQVLWGVGFQWRSLTNGENGIPGVPRPWIGPWHLTSSASFYLFVVVTFAICGGLLLLIVHSPFGLALQGLRESRTRMMALGYNVALFQFLSLLLSALFASIAGSLFAMLNTIAAPNVLSIPTGAEAVLMVILGGAGTMVGPFLGAVIIELLEFGVSRVTLRWESVLGIIYVLVILGAQSGIYPPILAFFKGLRRGGPKATIPPEELEWTASKP